MDGYLFIPDDFEKFRTKLREFYIKTPLTSSTGVINNTDHFDIYNFDINYMIIMKNPYKGILIFPRENLNEEDIKSRLECITGIKLERAKSNGN